MSGTSFRLFLVWSLVGVVAFWDIGTSTVPPERGDTIERMSFFRWQRVEFESRASWVRNIDWNDQYARRALNVVAGISIDMIPLSTACIMNRRILITSANYLDPYMNRQRDLRIWALGRTGQHTTPYRYRVWRVWRLFPKSANPEHRHGPRGEHVPRHDVSVIISHDLMYIYAYPPTHYHYPYRAPLTKAHMNLTNKLMFAGSGFEYMVHIKENYKIFYHNATKSQIVDCSKYLPKWWGKFICIRNIYHIFGVQNGGPLFSGKTLVGVGCFEIRYNEDRIFVFTDLRYYVRWIHKYADIRPGQYYEYAYPQWSIYLGSIFDGYVNYPFIPTWQVQNDLYPLGK